MTAVRSRNRPITWDRLVEMLDINPDTGVCVWKNPNPQSRCKIGSIAGVDKGDGYWRIMLDHVRYPRYVLVWFYVHKKWPENLIDHKDGINNHDWIGNLRPATASQNQQNNHRRKGASGLKGVSPKKGRYVARITLNQKLIHLGYFDTKEEAKMAYDAKASVLFGEYACA